MPLIAPNAPPPPPPPPENWTLVTPLVRRISMPTYMTHLLTKVEWWSVVAERSNALDSSFGVVRMWVSNPGLAGRGACVLEQHT